MSAHDYTVRLEQVFQGPLDLLLHLVREQEVDIHEIEIGRVVDGYLRYLEDLETIDIELAGEFVSMAATLIAIKTRALLPRGEEVDLEAELDPRDELIQRLIEYRHFKGAAGELHERFVERRKIAGRGFRQRIDGEGDEPETDLSEVTEWDLLATFSRLMRETLADRSMRIESDDRPLRFYVEALARTLRERQSTTLRQIVEDAVRAGEASKPYLVGTFCALLELVKAGAAGVHQDRLGGEVHLRLAEDSETDLEELIGGMGFEDEVVGEVLGSGDRPGATGEDPQPGNDPPGPPGGGGGR